MSRTSSARAPSELGERRDEVTVDMGWQSWETCVVRRAVSFGIEWIVEREKLDQLRRFRMSHQKCCCCPRPTGTLTCCTRLMAWVGSVRYLRRVVESSRSSDSE